MTDAEFMDQAELVLKAIEASCDRINDQTDADIDNQRSGGMVTLAFANGSQIIVNLQKPLHEIWVAAKCGGFHYRWDQGNWHDTKRSSDLFADLSAFSSEQSGLNLRFAPD